jgi:hypothetical protein
MLAMGIQNIFFCRVDNVDNHFPNMWLLLEGEKKPNAYLDCGKNTYYILMDDDSRLLQHSHKTLAFYRTC